MMRMKRFHKEQDRQDELRRGVGKFEELGKMKNPEFWEEITIGFLFRENRNIQYRQTY